MEEKGKISPRYTTPYIETVDNIHITVNEDNIREVKFPLKTTQMIELQKHDTESRKMVNNIRKERPVAKIYILHEGILDCEQKKRKHLGARLSQSS